MTFEIFNEKVHACFLKRLNLKPRSEAENQKLLILFFQLLEKHHLLFERSFFHIHNRNYKKLNLNESDSVFKEFTQLFDKFETDQIDLVKNKYFHNDEPCTLLIDEIENIWKPIAENDDWSLFETKLQSIRQIP